MPLIYGKVLDFQTLKKGSVGEYLPPKQKQESTTLFTWIINVATAALEVALTSTGLGAPVAAALGVGMAALRSELTSEVTHKP